MNIITVRKILFQNYQELSSQCLFDKIKNYLLSTEDIMYL